MTDTELPEGVTPEVAEFITMRQPRCVVCGSTYALHIHHRVFRSEGEVGVKKLLDEMFPIYRLCYQREIVPWSLHSVQNLIRICNDCHEGNIVGVHGGNEKLRRALRHSFTSPVSGMNIPFYKKPNRLSIGFKQQQYGISQKDSHQESSKGTSKESGSKESGSQEASGQESREGSGTQALGV